jgi:hypothetical protein
MTVHRNDSNSYALPQPATHGSFDLAMERISLGKGCGFKTSGRRSLGMDAWRIHEVSRGAETFVPVNAPRAGMGTLQKCNHWIKGDQAGSEASPGAMTRLSLRPVMSTDQICEPPPRPSRPA